MKPALAIIIGGAIALAWLKTHHRCPVCGLPFGTDTRGAAHQEGAPVVSVPRIITNGCAIDGCTKPIRTRGYCRNHYIAAMHAGHIVARTEAERFWEKVAVEPGQCWQWVAGRAGEYGQFDRRPAHRYAWEALVGPIPDGLQIDHLCRNTLCVNPDHLEVVDGRTNILRSYAPSALNARKTHCKNGHDDWVVFNGRRTCRPCKNAYYREYRRRAA